MQNDFRPPIKRGIREARDRNLWRERPNVIPTSRRMLRNLLTVFNQPPVQGERRPHNVDSNRQSPDTPL